MEKVSIKEAFGGEVPFTKFISEDKATADRMLVEIGLPNAMYTIKPEDATVDRKRVDLVIRDQNNEIFLVVESQDATGWLDSVHASKVFYYMWEKNCFDGVILMEDGDEHVKGYVQFMNENTPFNVYLFAVRIHRFEDGKLHVDFVPVMRPTNVREKKIRSITGGNDKPHLTEVVERLAEKLPNYFDLKSRYYVAKKGNSGLSASLYPQVRKIQMYIERPGGAETTDQMINTVTAVFPEHDVKHNRRGVYLHAETEEEALDICQKAVDAINAGTITE